MSLASSTHDSQLPRFRPALVQTNIEQRELLLLNFIHGDLTPAYKRTCIYVVLRAVEAYPDTSSSVLTYQLHRTFGYPVPLLNSVLTTLSSRGVMQLLKFWRNNTPKKDVKFYRVGDESMFNVLIDYYKRLHPELQTLQVELNIKKGE